MPEAPMHFARILSHALPTAYGILFAIIIVGAVVALICCVCECRKRKTFPTKFVM